MVPKRHKFRALYLEFDDVFNAVIQNTMVPVALLKLSWTLVPHSLLTLKADAHSTTELSLKELQDYFNELDATGVFAKPEQVNTSTPHCLLMFFTTIGAFSLFSVATFTCCDVCGQMAPFRLVHCSSPVLLCRSLQGAQLRPPSVLRSWILSTRPTPEINQEKDTCGLTDYSGLAFNSAQCALEGSKIPQTSDALWIAIDLMASWRTEGIAATLYAYGNDPLLLAGFFNATAQTSSYLATMRDWSPGYSCCNKPVCSTYHPVSTYNRSSYGQ